MAGFNKLLLWLFVILEFNSGLSKLTCRDENNNTVPWSYIYKLPKNKFSKNKLINDGVAYMYITPNKIQNGWIMATTSINSSNSIPGLTLAPLYSNNVNLLSLIYNDQPPEDENKEKSTVKPSTKPKPNKKNKRASAVESNSDSNTASERARPLKTTGGGHTKGVVISNENNGIWLIHSVPKYPPLPVTKNVKYSYPRTATKFGQSFLCLSLTASQIESVGMQLQYNEPKIIHKNLPSDLMTQFKSILDIMSGKTVKSLPWYRVTNLTTIDGTKFMSFAKSANFKDDLYEALVAQTFKTNMLVETWRNGPGVLKSNCTFKYRVNNIDKIAFVDNNIAFSSHSDHSKWAISVPSAKSCKTCDKDRWVCVGDINRAETQELRGGGTVCIQNKKIWSYYDKIINEIEECSGNIKQRLLITTI